MTAGDLVGLSLMTGLIGVLMLLVSRSRMPRGLKQLLYAALVLRVVGGYMRYWVLINVYDRLGDSIGYYQSGLEYAQYFWRFDFSPFYDRTLWKGVDWTGTAFVPFPSGVVLTLIGPSMLAEFIAFSLLAFAGIWGFVIAFKRIHPDIPVQRYARWVFLFPSLWFWPSSVGKESLILMGIGLSFAGFVGVKNRVDWPLLILGIFFVWSIRPQVAAVVISSYVLAYWLSLGTRWSLAKTVQGIVILSAGLAGIWFASRSMGVSDFGMEGLQEYMMDSQAQTTKGTTVEVVGITPAGIPMAMVNVLTRPWPWEATNAMNLLSALEMMGFWGIVLYRRKNLMRALRSWRSHALLRIAIPFILLYSISLGMLLVNLGIIARQRVFLFPFLFLLVECVPAVRRRVAQPVRPYRMQSVGAPPFEQRVAG